MDQLDLNLDALLLIDRSGFPSHATVGMEWNRETPFFIHIFTQESESEEHSVMIDDINGFSSFATHFSKIYRSSKIKERSWRGMSRSYVEGDFF